MTDVLLHLFIFSAKAIIIVALILLALVAIVAILAASKEKLRAGTIQIKNLNKKYLATTEELLTEVLSKHELKKFHKEKKAEKKKKEKSAFQKNIFVLRFDGDIKASAVNSLREEVTAVLGIAKPNDEVVVCLESPGGAVHAYGLAASQLERFKQQNIPLTVVVDKVAASGGYLMACIANKILAAPFAIIGSIGVVVSLPNFHRFLKEHNIDFEQHTAGSFKRTITLFGQNTKEGREKLQEEIEEIHGLFKNVIQQHRQQVDIDKVATGEHWLGAQALELKLVDELRTSDDYLLAQSKDANLFEITYQTKKSLSDKLSSSIKALVGAIKNNTQQSFYS